VVLTGHVENHRIEDYYAMIDVFVIPRIDDLASRLVVPLKPLEAMAMERPLLASDLPALRELVVPGERGEVFQPGNPDALAAAAEKLIAAPDQRARLASAARSWVLRERTTAANARRYARTLHTITGRGQ
jgi:glycosyltransferase involved in cell wall biosynthesis